MVKIRSGESEAAMPRGSEELTNARKEEIFLALLKREHDAWIEDIEEMMCQNTSIDAEAFAETMARILEKTRLYAEADVHEHL